MRRNYVGVAQFLQSNYDRVTVEGDNYPPPPFVELLGHLLWALQALGLMWAVLGGERLLSLVGLARRDAQNRYILPHWYYTIQENRVQIGTALFLLLPQFLSRWTVTGAFEIYVGDAQVWSKLQMGRFPNQDELIQALATAGLTRRR